MTLELKAREECVGEPKGKKKEKARLLRGNTPRLRPQRKTCESENSRFQTDSGGGGVASQSVVVGQFKQQCCNPDFHSYKWLFDSTIFKLRSPVFFALVLLNMYSSACGLFWMLDLYMQECKLGRGSFLFSFQQWNCYDFTETVLGLVFFVFLFLLSQTFQTSFKSLAVIYNRDFEAVVFSKVHNKNTLTTVDRQNKRHSPGLDAVSLCWRCALTAGTV